MTLLKNRDFFSAWLRSGAWAMFAGGVLMVSSCASTTIEDAVPQTVAASVPAPEQRPTADTPVEPQRAQEEEIGAPTAELDRSRIRNTGEFPNTNTVPDGATEQMTAEQKAEFLARMKEEQDRQNRNAADAAAYQSKIQRMRDLARNHGQDALDEIEDGQ